MATLQNTNNFDEIRQRLHAFARRHYLNVLLQNSAIFLAASAIIILIMSLLELFLKSSVSLRVFYFYSLVIALMAGFVYLVLLPGLRMMGMLKGLSEIELSQRVGERVKEIDDKLLNILLLEQMNKSQENAFVKAAISQKAVSISNIPFHLSASLKKGLKFVRYASIGLVVMILMGMTFPDVFNYGTKRLVYYSEDIQPPPPFTFRLNSDLKAIKNEAFEIEVAISGDVLPRNVNIVMEDRVRKSVRRSQNEFYYSVRNVSDEFVFYLEAEGVKSKEYKVEVIERPAIESFDISISFPDYLGKKPLKVLNTGNLTVPVGSRLEWNIRVDAGKHVNLNFEGDQRHLESKESIAVFDSTFFENINYSMLAHNDNNLMSDSIEYRLRIIEDEYPEIEVVEKNDSLNSREVFIGRISDDYGIASFRFAYKLDSEETYQYKELKTEEGKITWDFLYEIDWDTWDLEKGDEVVYFFEVWDNDGVNGSKYSRSNSMMHKVLSEDEIEEKKEELANDIESELEDALKEAEEINKEVKELQKDLIDEKKIDWSTKKKVEDLIRRNENLKKTVDEINSKNNQKNLKEDDLKHSDEINKKREELDRLMKEIMDDEMLEKLKELEALMEKLNKDELQKKMEEIELSNEQLENELDRSLELFKQLEFEMQLEKTLEELSELQEKQEDLTRDVEEDNPKDSPERQEEILEEFKEWEKEMEKLEEMNENLEDKKALEENEEKREEAKEEMNNAKENLEKGKKKKAGQNQKSAEQKMSEMKDDLNALQASMQASAMEDIQSLRNTLENLLELSFQQENLMEEMKKMRANDPKFNEATREQRAILDGLTVVEDSLRALSKRVVEIEATVNRELTLSKLNMERSLRSMTERKMGQLQQQQQLSMTSINNLSVLLDEIVDQLQQQMAQSTGQCSKPGQSKPGSSSMKQMQKDLNKQIEEMKKMLEQGKNPGKKPGGGQGQGMKKGEEAESLAKTAAQQAKIREALRQMEEKASQQEAKELKKLGDLMEETERDIVNRNISRETLMRQEKILTKLLEAENAERQQDMEKKRLATEGREKRNGNLFDVKEYYKARYSNHEELIKQNISFSRYYNQRVEEYFKMINP